MVNAYDRTSRFHASAARLVRCILYLVSSYVAQLRVLGGLDLADATPKNPKAAYDSRYLVTQNNSRCSERPIAVHKACSEELR